MVDNLFGDIYSGKKVLVTGSLGFKGSWLTFWLESLGAEVYGYSLHPGTDPCHSSLVNPGRQVMNADIRDTESLESAFHSFKPEIIFHLAAQPLVRLSYKNPVDTFEVNVMGTLKVFEAARKAGSVTSIINVTSDKCYENREWYWGYKETDPMGGYDPYSASKGCAELVTASYRNSYFPRAGYGKQHNTLLASVRAGNVIGGGDWAEDRIIPDLVRSKQYGKPVEIRNPFAIRPWQHVLDPLSGYLQLGQKLLEGNVDFSDSFNFGPSAYDTVTVKEIAVYFRDILDLPAIKMDDEHSGKLHEATNLKLDCSKAMHTMLWHPVWSVQKSLEKTAAWYKAYLDSGAVNTQADLDEYIHDAKQEKLAWTKY